MSVWNFRIIELEYEDGSSYVLETDRGEPDNWYSIFRSPDLETVRAIKAEREAKRVPKSVKVIE